MNTPWRQSDTCEKLADHVYFVTTPSHGGVMIAKGTARKILTKEAQAKGMDWQGYLCYEEDCLWSVVAYELPELFVKTFTGENTVESIKENALKTLSSWDADYLLARGIMPEPKGYAYYCKRKEDDRKRQERCPDYIVSASSIDNGRCKVWTADGSEHIVNTEKYHAVQKTGSYSLAECV